MEDSPLNKAHQLERRAEALLKRKKFDESIEAHKNAIKHLNDSLLLTENEYARESIQLQIDNHQKQIDLLDVKKQQYEQRQRYLETTKQKVNFIDVINTDDKDCIQNTILHTIDTNDSLVEMLFKRKTTDEIDGGQSDENHDDSIDPNQNNNNNDNNTECIIGKKLEVDDSTIIEEYKVLSCKLRELVQSLFLQVEERDLEIARLRTEISRLENDKNKAQSKNSGLKVATDSSGGSTSPYVFSPCSESSPDVHDTRHLPSLAPLEMPNIDLQLLMKKHNNSGN